MTEYPPSVEAMLQPQGATCPLEDFATAWESDDTVAWRVETGHLVNLLEDAFDRLGLFGALEATPPVEGLTVPAQTAENVEDTTRISIPNPSAQPLCYASSPWEPDLVCDQPVGHIGSHRDGNHAWAQAL